MANLTRARRRRRSALGTQILRVAGEGRDRLEEHWVSRVLTQLEDDALIVAVGNSPAASEGVRLECGFADQIWEHAEIQARVRQLAERGVEAQLVSHESRIAGRTFTRPQILVRLAH